jgi:hypothetical protein
MFGLVAQWSSRKAVPWARILSKYLIIRGCNAIRKNWSYWQFLHVKRIWFRRNSVVHDGELTHSNQVFQEASTQICEFRRYNVPNREVSMTTPESSPALWQIVRDINTELPQLSRYGHLVNDIRKVLLSLRSFKVVHVKRDANEAAHNLTKEAVTHVINLIWLEDIPPIIYDIICRKCSIPFC